MGTGLSVIISKSHWPDAQIPFLTVTCLLEGGRPGRRLIVPQIKKHIVCSNTLRKLSKLQSSYHQLHPAASPRPPSFPFSLCFEVYFPTFSLEFFPSCSGWWRSSEEGNFEGSSILYYHTRLPSSPLNKALEETKQQKNCFLKGNYKVTPPQPMHPGQTPSQRNPHPPSR